MSNASLYKKCGEASLSMQVLKARYGLFGHVVRRDQSIAFYEVMYIYFLENNKRATGRPQTSLPVILNIDLETLVTTKLEIRPQKDLDTLRHVAENRTRWTSLITEIRKSAVAATLDDLESRRLFNASKVLRR
ncbi:hypothetical protein ElyMa_000916900 [Elysia marginata]|uniref:Uncharacterized protein n=1 Tax=Elysia marginata TaxID=1093978 RepID=A0AAV4HBA2_9GAST|nr:hypothetical protein ElyMa_000916900 [Elysia marginata]